MKGCSDREKQSLLQGTEWENIMTDTKKVDDGTKPSVTEFDAENVKTQKEKIRDNKDGDKTRVTAKKK
jgi:hypothetical protein